MNEISLQKKRLRHEAGDRRRVRHAADSGEAGEAAAKHFIDALLGGFGDLVSPSPPQVVAAYWAVRDELATQPLLMRLSESSMAICLPAVAQNAAPLVFRQWRPGDAMVDGVHDIPVPGAGATEVIPTIVVTPMLAFDAAGYRLGYGGGYYDRTLAALRNKGGNILAVGFAYEEQHMDEIPHDHLDQPLDWVVTEQGVRKVGR